MKPNYLLWVGVDWASQAHQVCVIDRRGQVVSEHAVEHSGAGIAKWTQRMRKLARGKPERVAVAIETPRGAVVETLLERGFHVFSINPKQLDRFRDRHRLAGAKDDRLDAFVLASSVRTDTQCFRRLELDHPLVIQLRELSRIDSELQTESRRLANRLRELLYRYFPQLLRLSPAADEPWLWRLLEMAPTPHAARRLRNVQLKKLLQAHSIRRFDPERLRSELQAPDLQLAPGSVEAFTQHVGLLLPRLRISHQQRKVCQKNIETLLAQLTEPATEGEFIEHRDVAILRSMPGAGRLVTATMLAEASQPLGQRDYHSLRALAGTAPITKQSGKSRLVLMRRGCNYRIRNAVYHWARTSIQNDILCAAFYQACRQRGHSHPRALRALGDRLLRILVVMLRNQATYHANLAAA